MWGRDSVYVCVGTDGQRKCCVLCVGVQMWGTKRVYVCGGPGVGQRVCMCVGVQMWGRQVCMCGGVQKGPSCAFF